MELPFQWQMDRQWQQYSKGDTSMNIQDCKIGDIAVFRDGTEAKIVDYQYMEDGTWLLFFDRKVKGLLIGSYSNEWVYGDDGKFETTRTDGNDIVKIVRS